MYPEDPSNITTRCSFFIYAGENSKDVSTSLFQLGQQKIASIGLSGIYSQELAGVFPADHHGTFSILMKPTSKVTFEIIGAHLGNSVVAFSMR